jgi:hypothetical protein
MGFHDSLLVPVRGGTVSASRDEAMRPIGCTL